MGLEKVEDEILGKGKERAAAIEADGVQQAAVFLKEAQEKIKALRAAREAELASAMERMKAQSVSGAHMELKRRHLVLERELTERAAEEAKRALAAMPQAQEEALLRALIQRHEKEGAVIYCAKRNEAFVRAVSLLRFGGTVPCLGGIVIESADGTVRNDHTYDTVLKETLDSGAGSVAEVLFR